MFALTVGASAVVTIADKIHYVSAWLRCLVNLGYRCNSASYQACIGIKLSK